MEKMSPPPPPKKTLLSDCVFLMKICAVKSHTLTGGRGGGGENEFLSIFVPRVFFDMDPYVMLLSLTELRANGRTECYTFLRE